MQYLQINYQDDNIDPIQDLANRVKKFYYYRALLCEKWLNGDVNIQNIDQYYRNMNPVDYCPFDITDAYVIACASIDGLSSIWSSLNQLTIRNTERFCSFLVKTQSNPHLERVSTPFLVYYLQKYPFEQSDKLIKEIQYKWMNYQDSHECHRVYEDPSFSELENLYLSCLPDSIINNNNHKQRLNSAIKKCTYNSLIYTLYRCSFVHTFRESKYMCGFNKGNKISVKKFDSYILPDGTNVNLKNSKPQLDVGIGLFIESIKKGADIIYDLIIQKQYLDIPYDINDEIMNRIL